MKAKEYAKRFKERPTDSNLRMIIVDFMGECDDLIKYRNVKTDEAAVAVLDEQHKKWQAFARILNKDAGVTIIKENGFALVLKEKIPELYQAWQRHKMFVEVRKAARNVKLL